MKKIFLYLVLFVSIYFVLILTGCGSTKETEQKQEVKEIEPIQEDLIKKDLIGYYFSNEGIISFNTKEKTKINLLKISNANLRAQSLSPDKKYSIFVLYNDNETIIYKLEFDKDEIKQIKKLKGDYNINIFWDTNSFIINQSLVKRSKNQKDVTYSNPYTEIYDTKTLKLISGYKPRRGIVLEDFIQGKYLVYSDLTNLYINDKFNTKTLKTFDNFSYDDMHNLTFSPDGMNAFYILSKQDPDIKSKKAKANEIIIMDYLGKNSKTIFTTSNNPRNPRWSPDSKNILCDIESPDSKGVRYMVIYDLMKNHSFFKKETTGEWKYSLEDGHWLFNGDLILLKKILNNDENPLCTYEIRDNTLFTYKIIEHQCDKLGDYLTCFNDSLLLFKNSKGNNLFFMKDGSLINDPEVIDYLFLKTLN